MNRLLVLLAACASPTADLAEEAPDAGGRADESCGLVVPSVSVGATTRVNQLTGEDDRERRVLAHNRTLSRFGLWGTDLGASFLHDGRTYFLFGDSIADVEPSHCGDAIATSTDGDASDGIDLEFLTDAGGHYVSPSVPGTRLECYEVPLDGTSANGAMYVWFSTETMTRSVLARSNDGGASFTRVHDLSSKFFVNVSVVREGDTLYLFGSGLYRESEVYLAKVDVAAIEDRSAYRFYAGRDGCGELWSADETAAVSLFGPACVGELSAHHDAALGAWTVFYNCGEPRGIQARVAHGPTGPWSEQAMVFEPWQSGGYCHFMHTSHDFENCDQVHDPGRETEWGGEYGPYVVEGASQSLGEHAAALYFVLSTWNPYNTMLMRTELTLASSSSRASH